MEVERIIITGASRGIGEAIAYRLARKGRRLLLLARTERDLERVSQRAREQGADVEPRSVDLARTDQVERLLGEIERDFGPVDALILNAGVANQRPFLETDLASIDYEMRVNFATPAQFMRRVLRPMIARDRGSVVVVGSLTSVVPFPGNASYAASKAALQALVRSLRLELAATSVHLGLVLPGFTASSMTADMSSLLPAMSADDVARAVERCLKERRSFVVPGLINKVGLRLFSAAPALTDAVLARLPSPGPGRRWRRTLWPRVS